MSYDTLRTELTPEEKLQVKKWIQGERKPAKPPVQRVPQRFFDPITLHQFESEEFAILFKAVMDRQSQVGPTEKVVEMTAACQDLFPKEPKKCIALLRRITALHHLFNHPDFQRFFKKPEKDGGFQISTFLIAVCANAPVDKRGEFRTAKLLERLPRDA